ncbi:MAG: hypothetical protein Q8909_04455 [Bacteroidota bacterium]|nr:hypothetical protein [Bacteroidota bacterium]
MNSFPFYADNVHTMPSLVNGMLWSGENVGIDLQNKVPMVCLDDFRSGHKFDNPLGADGIGYLSLKYWFPSNGNYLLFYYVLENGMDYFREFLVTTTLSGVYIDHLLVKDGWYVEEPKEINFTQAQLNADLSLKVTEIRNLSSSYVKYSSLITFYGQKVVSNYKINTNGKFVLGTTNPPNPQRYFSISELKELLTDIDPPQSGSFTMLSGYNYLTNGIVSYGYAASFYLVFYPTSTMSVGTSYRVATVSENCRPTVARVLSFTTGGNTWSVTVNPNGDVYAKIVSGSPVYGSAYPTNNVVSLGTLMYNF